MKKFSLLPALALFAVMLFAFVADAGPRRGQCLDGSCQISAAQSVQAEAQPNKEHVTVYPSYTFMREAEQVGFYDAMYKDFQERQKVSSTCSANGSCNQQSAAGNTGSERRHPLRTLFSIGIGKRCRR